ncbi:MAG: hypothetical protein J6Y57_00505, partial [Lachnospiraceae bacterium]|nr:hypothetical protein [Lachnospiraceae bacterium]
SRLFVNRLRSAAILIIILFMHIGTLWGGNTLEEYMLPLNLLVIFLTLRAALPRENNTEDLFRLHFENIPASVAIITGICFGVMLFAKVTVASPIAGVVIAVCLNDLLDINFRALFRYLAFAFLGVVIAALPIFLYFGYHDMIPRMLYCVFEFATKRSVDFSEPFNKDWELKTIGAIFAFSLRSSIRNGWAAACRSCCFPWRHRPICSSTWVYRSSTILPRSSRC